MKNLILIIHASAQQDVADTLRELDSVPGFTFSHVEGHGESSEGNPLISARDKVVGYTPHVRVDILLEDTHVNEVLRSLREKLRGLGTYWITPVDAHGHL